jgi:hypothetical protein
MKNPYPQQPGFKKRVAYVKAALIRYAHDSSYHIFTRAFDDCFENYDGDAVVFALGDRAKKMLKMAIAGFLRVCKKCLGIILNVGDKGTLQSKCSYLDNNVSGDPSLLAEVTRHRLGFCRRYCIQWTV